MFLDIQFKGRLDFDILEIDVSKTTVQHSKSKINIYPGQKTLEIDLRSPQVLMTHSKGGVRIAAPFPEDYHIRNGWGIVPYVLDGFAWEYDVHSLRGKTTNGDIVYEETMKMAPELYISVDAGVNDKLRKKIFMDYFNSFATDLLDEEPNNKDKKSERSESLKSKGRKTFNFLKSLFPGSRPPKNCRALFK